MVEIRVGDIDSKGTNGGTEYIIDVKPTILAFHVRLLDILDDASRDRFQSQAVAYVQSLKGEDLVQAIVAEYDKFVARRKSEIKVVR
jgi:hypothetical protein